MARQIKKKSIIQTKRLTIKPLSEQDKGGLTDILSSKEVTKTYIVPKFNSPQELQNLAEKLITFSRIEDETHLEYGIYLNEKIIGFINDCGFSDDEIEIGYVIHPQYQGQGYATEAVQAVIEELKQMGFKRVIAGYFSQNIASFKVMKKCGMQPIDRTEKVEYRGEIHVCKYCELFLE